ncbi:MAG: type II toxin-antitoxin system VapB family antitoxin [Melioribacteraceae bacterium]|nr:type II toxin-antitoxin system VapB family antitoxin [Melioribacteraceae bacterium]
MRTNIVIDDKLMELALKISEETTKRKVVEEALKLFVQTKKQTRLKKFKGLLKWEGDIDEMRTDKMRTDK